MKLERAEIRQIAMPLVSPFETSGNREVIREALLVTLYGEGLAGWGEVVAESRPWYSSETIVTTGHALRDFLLPAVLGQTIEDIEGLRGRIGWVKGHQMAKAGLEMAWWDLHGKATGQSLRAMLGGLRERVQVGVSVGIQPTAAALVEAVSAYREEGYGRIKIKVKPGWLHEPVAALRVAFGQGLPLMVDANNAFTLDDADDLRALDQYGLLMIEQPLAHDDLARHARLQAMLRTPICLDESIESVADCEAALALRAGRIVNIKPGRVGGLSQGRAIHDLCAAAGVPVWCGGMLETGIGRASNLAIASLPNYTLPGDISASRRYYAEDLIAEPFELNREDSTMTAPDGPGLGVEVVAERVDEVTRHREAVGVG